MDRICITSNLFYGHVALQDISGSFNEEFKKNSAIAGNVLIIVD